MKLEGLPRRLRNTIQNLEQKKKGNATAKELTTNRQYGHRVERDRTKYNRKQKHRNRPE